ncbi:MAG: type VI secretion system membrane subunit TssM [Gammaproteobacteria bacterium]|nr:type VI secretion system membrane subunit TssM [Gammaproteobacteria bacterium]
MAFLRQGWFYGLIGLLAICALIWLIGPYLAIAGWAPFESVTARVVATALILFFGAIVLAFVVVRKRRANAGLMNGIASDEGPGQAGMGREELARMREQFEQAIRTLKQARGRRGGISLYELPWYVIIGPPGAGKTTVLSNSGLRFPLASRFGNKAVRGVGGTRNCDWWFTDEAIFLDTAGRYTTQDSNEALDREGWLGFLDLLKRYRRRRPINGVLIAISVQDVLTLDAHQRQEHVAAIRKRIGELRRHFGIRFPIYIILTKCDLIPGFVDFFEDLGADERTQVWGFTFDVEESKHLGDLDERLRTEFAALVERLRARVVRRMHEERDLERRSRVFTFPDQVADVLDTVRGFVFDTFAPSAYEEPAFVRGIYLTSGTQEGAPIDRLLGGLARSFGLEAAMTSGSGGQGRSYFITRLLRDVMFQESGLTGVDRRFERHLLWMQRAAYLGAAVVTVAAITLWSVSYSLNRGHLEHLAALDDAYAAAVAASDAESPALRATLPRLQALVELRDAAVEQDADVPLTMRLGLYQGDYLATAATDAHVREVNTQLLSRVKHALETELANPARDVYHVYELLRVYLMLGDPAHFEVADVVATARLLGAADPGMPAADLETLVANLRDGLQGEPRPQALRPEVVDRARQRLRAEPLEVFVLNRIKRDYERRGTTPQRLSDILGLQGQALVTRRSGQPLDTPIPGLYTAKGFYETFTVQSAKAISTLADEKWVLGIESGSFADNEIAGLPGRLQALYEGEYIKFWDTLINDIDLVHLRGLGDASDKLLILSGQDSPIRTLLNALARNTRLSGFTPPALPGALADTALGEKVAKLDAASQRLGAALDFAASTGAVGNAPGKRIEEHFAPLASLVRDASGGPGRLDGLLAMFGQLQGQLAGTGSGLGMQSATTVVAQGDPARGLELHAQNLPEPVKRWVLQVAQDIRGGVAAGAAREVKAQIDSGVTQTCRQLIGGRYPFNRTATVDVKLADFARLFAPGGVLDQFFNTRIASMVDTSARPWRWRSADGLKLGLSNDALRQFERAAAIRDSFFMAGGQMPKIYFDVKTLRLSPDAAQVMMVIDGQQVVYRHGPVQAQRIEWPGKSGPSEVRIVFTRLDGTQQSQPVAGPWALFRIFDQLGQPGSSPDALLLNLALGQSSASFEFVSGSVLNPLGNDLLSGFTCPGGAR